MLTTGHGSVPLRAEFDTGEVNTEILRTLHKKRKGWKTPRELTFTLTVTPAIDAAYAIVAEPLAAFARDPEARAQVARHWNEGKDEGPVARLRQIEGSPVHGAFVRELLDLTRNIDHREFMHRHREAWRTTQWTTLARHRPEAFAGLDGTLDRAAAVCCLKWEEKQADKFQAKMDMHKHKELWHTRDPRYRAQIMRALIHGGMLTRERVARHNHSPSLGHDQQALLRPGEGLCRCGGGYDTVEHVSWCCPRYAAERAPALQVVSDYTRYPMCFRYALLPVQAVMQPDPQSGLPQLGVDEVFQVHLSILEVWLAYARERALEGDYVFGD